MTSMSKISSFLKNNAYPLSVDIVKSVLISLNLVISEHEKQQAINMYAKLLDFLSKYITEDENNPPNALIDWSKKNALQQVESGGKISDIAVRYPPTRNVFIDLITQKSIEFGLTLKENAQIIRQVNSILDISLNETILAFELISEKYREETQREMAILSAPVVLIKDDVAILPLIGIMDSYRAMHISDYVVPKIAELQLQYLIADYSGILNINTYAANNLRDIAGVLQLLGIEIIVTGLRPELVQTVVHSGIDMNGIQTFAHVKQALNWINKRDI
ncbi:STAS domain-containing protein [Peribacillus simplex]|uniref:STAS domain-containing protein n=1 Tax=Peribacillus simplex TaxID=1478 RepID=UPI00333C5CCA